MVERGQWMTTFWRLNFPRMSGLFLEVPFWELILGIAFEFGAAGRGGVDWVAAGDDFSGQGDDEVAGPASGLVDGVVGAEELGSAGDHGVAWRCRWCGLA